MAQKPPPREQEQQIRARKTLLYEADEGELPPTPVVPIKPFAEHLRDTPAFPLSGGTKAILWALGVVVALLLVAALARSARPRAQPGARPKAARVAMARDRAGGPPVVRIGPG